MKSNLEVTLISGAVLKGSIAEFAVGLELYQSMISVLGDVDIDPQDELNIKLLKSLMSKILSDKNLEKSIWACMSRMTYNDQKITKDTFEPIEARQDYIEVLKEVALFNAAPFTKNLFVQFQTLLEMLEKNFSQK